MTTRSFSELTDELYDRSPESRRRVADKAARLTEAARPPTLPQKDLRLPKRTIQRVIADSSSRRWREVRVGTFIPYSIEVVDNDH